MEIRDIEIMSGKTDERCQGDWKSRYMEKKVHIIQKKYQSNFYLKITFC